MQQMPGYGGVADFLGNKDAMRAAHLSYLQKNDVSGPSWAGQGGGVGSGISNQISNFYNTYNTPTTVNNAAMQMPQMPQFPQQQQAPPQQAQAPKAPEPPKTQWWNPQTGKMENLESGQVNQGYKGADGGRPGITIGGGGYTAGDPMKPWYML